MILSSSPKEIPMFPRFRNFPKFVAAGAFVALFASNPAGADEIVQNLGPVGPNDTLLATVGGMRVIAFSNLPVAAAASTQWSGTRMPTLASQQNAFGFV
jgi:hypothetical protein